MGSVAANEQTLKNDGEETGDDGLAALRRRGTGS